MGRDVPSPVAPSAHETTVEIGAGPADEEPMTAVSPVVPDHEHVSPELALVDPDLAGRLRVSLPEPELERAPPPPVQPPREEVETPRLRLAPMPFEAPAVAEPVVVEEQEPAVVAEPLVVEGLPEAVRPPEVVEEPVVVEEPWVFEGAPVVAPADVLDEPHPVDEPRDFGPGPAADAFTPVTDLGEDALPGASLRVEPRPVDIATPPALAPVATTTAAWPPVPDADAEPERGRLRRLVFVFGLGMVAASLAVVGLVALFGDPGPPPPLTLAGPTPSSSPQPASGDPQAGSTPSTPSTSSSGRKQTSPSGSSSGGKQSSPPAAVPPAESRRLVWAPVEGAVSYRVELFRGERQIFRDTTRSPAIVLPARWKHEGRAERLTPGTYRWYVWPVTSSGPAATAVVQAELVVP